MSTLSQFLNGTTTQAGIVALVDSVSSTSITTAATPNSVKIAYDRALSAGAKGAGTNAIFYENDQEVTGSYTITVGKNAMTAGPVTINSGVTVTVPSGSFWVIV